MTLSSLPPLLTSAFAALAVWLDKRTAARLPLLLAGVLFARGRRTVTSWFRAAGISDDYRQYPGVVARAVALLRGAGVGGPYAIGLGPRCYTGVIETTEHGGYPVLEHIRLILGGPVVWAPAVDGAVVVSQRGDDFRLVGGEDFAIGYAGHDGDAVRLYLEESFTFEVIEPRAAVSLVYPSGKKR